MVNLVDARPALSVGAGIPAAAFTAAADALAGALSDLLDAGPETWSQLGRAARRRVEDRFELHAVAKRYGAFYEGLLACAE